MRKYLVIIKNESGVIIYENTIIAKDENKALVEVLDDCYINSGDTIKIEEV